MCLSQLKAVVKVELASEACAMTRRDKHVLHARATSTALKSTNDISARHLRDTTSTIANVLAAMRGNPSTAQEIADRSGVDLRVVKAVLAFLAEFGLVKREGSRMVLERELQGLPGR